MTADRATTSGPNAELFVAVLAQIEKHPETWDQANYVNECGTAFCFAGWALKLSDALNEELEPRGLSNGGYSGSAEHLLGIDLSTAPACCLFQWDNTLDDLYRISADLLGIDETTLRDKVAAVVADGATQAVSS